MNIICGPCFVRRERANDWRVYRTGIVNYECIGWFTSARAARAFCAKANAT